MRVVIVASVLTFAAPAFAQTQSPIAQDASHVTGVAEPGSFLCDQTQDGGITCNPTPLLPCGSPVPLRGGSESMAHFYCESQIPDRVKDDPGRKLFPRRNAIVTCMTKWRKSNQLGLAAAQKNSTATHVARPPEQETPRQAKPVGAEDQGVAQTSPPKLEDNAPNAGLKPQSPPTKPDVAGISGAGSYSCDWSKAGALNCQPIPVLSCGTSRLNSIDSEEKARENCENFVPQSIQDEPERKLFPRKTALASCLNRWRMSREHRQMPVKQGK
ncbi:hypothetical protein [Methylocapsa palsarum]|uniref:hypothetical protein n=1 Tax=Methylocapsa palsarum TaxID=1612308 RepID=UPI0011144542|nr:hypothetical protein [Methylocapsa palsarum]